MRTTIALAGTRRSQASVPKSLLSRLIGAVRDEISLTGRLFGFSVVFLILIAFGLYAAKELPKNKTLWRFIANILKHFH